MNVLVIAPHPDDESIGCGGTICLHTDRGDHVAAVFLTSGEFALSDLTREKAWAIREGEAEESARILGITSVTFLRRPDHCLGDGIEEAATELRPLLERQQPQLIYLPHAYDGHPDHRACRPIVQAALSSSLIPPPTLLGYELWTPLSEYDRVENIGQTMARKLQAVRAHRSQIKQIRYDRAVSALNEYRGTMTQVGRYAEVFQFADDRFAAIPRNRRTDPAWHLVYEVPSRICPSISRNRSESIVRELENLRVTADLRHRAAVLVQRAYRSVITNLFYLRAVGTHCLKFARHCLANVLHTIVFRKRRPDLIAQERGRRNQAAG